MYPFLCVCGFGVFASQIPSHASYYVYYDSHLLPARCISRIETITARAIIVIMTSLDEVERFMYFLDFVHSFIGVNSMIRHSIPNRLSQFIRMFVGLSSVSLRVSTARVGCTCEFAIQ